MDHMKELKDAFGEYAEVVNGSIAELKAENAELRSRLEDITRRPTRAHKTKARRKSPKATG